MADWDDLKVFLAVARGESLSRAGRVLKLDAATVGRRVARLEQALDARLFTRSPQGYVLTDEGGRLVAHAEAIETAMERAAEALAGPSEGISGQIRIGAPDGCANYLLPQVVAGIVAQNPGLEVQIVALPRVFNLSRREADMVIAVSKPEQGRVIATKITDYHLHLAASDRYLREAPPLKTLADLRAHRVIGYIPDMIFDRELDYLADLGVEQPPMASNSVSVQLNLIRQGAGVGVAHDFALPAAAGVRRVLTSDFSLTRAFWLIRHADDRKLPRIERFAAALVAGMRAEMRALEGQLQDG
ncbi:LysR family transcriptional regulator [Pararhodobacter zhoushanensis]|uniref:LysR family transcriptional regulator n=1 Tax=Pararhodobacter zhoushanensis TaxID=2479545 RepID=A0ABT3H141_9RHOB|nr:LysR family transcriptional regulator [Pararhodobacter zhoushanensis]MCW1933522.1 LysR family transcriptional regulator [Pararhodobacter zhoushanensis]